MKTIAFYKVVGEIELSELAKKEFKFFSMQTNSPLIFYKTLEDANKIAQECYTNDETGNFLGFVVEIEVNEDYFFKNLVQNTIQNNYIISEQELGLFNNAIVYRIRVIDVFIGNHFKKFKNDLIEDGLSLEANFHEIRLDVFLSSTKREIIPSDFFDRSNDELDEKEIKGDREIMIQKVKSINSIEEAIDFLIEKELNEEQLKAIKSKTPLTQIEYYRDHFGINQHCRNLFFYSNDNQKFKESVEAYGNSSFSQRGELGEGYLADFLWRKLNNCQIEHLLLLDEIHKIENEIQTFYDEYYKKNGKVRYEIDFDDSSNDDFFKGLSKMYDEKGLHFLNKRKELLTYNFSEEEIKKYLELEIKIAEEPKDVSDLIYEKKAILGKVEPENDGTFKKLKGNLLKIEKVIHTLNQYHL